MDTFQGPAPHLPLSQDEIRLVMLSPASFDDPIVCELVHVCLSDHHDYSALSYCWGDPTITNPITLNGQPYPVTTNLELALRYIRLEHECRPLWIDALCINQSDLRERSHQVRRMREIYLEATRVMIWIGAYAPFSKEEVDEAFDIACQMNEQLLAAMKQVHLGEFNGDLDADAVNPGDYSKAVEDQVARSYFDQDFVRENASALSILHEILDRPWFCRVWVVQEVAVSKNLERIYGDDGPVFLCGWSEMPFWWLTCFALHMRMSSLVSPSQSTHLGMMMISSLRILHISFASGRLKKPLAEQLLMFFKRVSGIFQAMDEKDKIYAFLGLLSYETFPSCLEVDYALTRERILRDYARYILEETGNLDILAFGSFHRQSLPSWVPDWSRTAQMTSTRWYRDNDLRFLAGGNKLEVDGVIVGRIETVLPALGLPDFMDDLQKYGIEDPASEDTISEAVEQTAGAILAYETKLFGAPALTANLPGPRLAQWLDAFTVGYDMNTSAFESHPFEEVYRMFFGDTAECSIMVILNFCYHVRRRFQFATYKDAMGNFGRLCNEADCPRPGDVIGFLRGAGHEFILRPEDEEWRVVGIAALSEDEQETCSMRTASRDFWTPNSN